jgi:hypothetical protein
MELEGVDASGVGMCQRIELNAMSSPPLETAII